MSKKQKNLLKEINKALGNIRVNFTPPKPSPNSRFKLPVSPTLTAARRNALGITPLKLNFNNKKK
jgi:hypothetical protein